MASDELTTIRDFKDHIPQFIPNLQVLLGLSWGSCFHSDRYYLGINAGWETDIYWNQYNIPSMLQSNNFINSYLTSYPSYSSEAVTMGGLTLNVQLDF